MSLPRLLLYKEMAVQMLDELEQKVGYSFLNSGLLAQALTHSSYARENNTRDNERLEFLGDALLNAVVGSCLFNLYPDFDEGDLTKFRAQIINKKNLCRKAKKYNIGKFLILGKGEHLTKGREKDSTLADTLEAIIGAVFLDSNYETTEKILLAIFAEDMKDDFKVENYKGKLQEICEKRYRCKPVYQIVAEKGQAHKKIFSLELRINGKIMGRGTGKSKRDAAQSAAKEALNSEELGVTNEETGSKRDEEA